MVRAQTAQPYGENLLQQRLSIPILAAAHQNRGKVVECDERISSLWPKYPRLPFIRVTEKRLGQIQTALHAIVRSQAIYGTQRLRIIRCYC